MSAPSLYHPTAMSDDSPGPDSDSSSASRGETSDRYLKQRRLPCIGDEGQDRLAGGRVLVVGVGALGSLITEQLVRAGVGHLRLVDRDIVDRTNLQRQLLYTDADAEAGLPKALAAEARLRAVNREVRIESHVMDVTPSTIGGLVEGVDVLIDGTDNLETRYLLNDVAIDRARPWVYGGCVGTFGQAAALVPGRTPCFRCLFPEPPPTDALPTCDSAGVLGPAVHVIASLESTLAMRLLVDGPTNVPSAMLTADPWAGTFRRVELGEPASDCPACQRRELEWLSGERTPAAVSLCGRNTVQIAAPAAGFELPQIVERLEQDGAVEQTRFLVRWHPRERPGWRVTLFRDGRTLIEGTDDVAAARAFHARFIGS